MGNTDSNSILAGIRGIIFDYGGTIDSRGDHWSHIIRDAYSAAGAILPEEAFREAYVYGERYLATNPVVKPTDNFHALMIAKMRAELSWLVDNKILSAEALDDLPEKLAGYCYDAALNAVGEARHVLEALSERYPMVLVSNFYGNIASVLADFRLDRYFRSVIESAVVGVRKPDPQIFRLGVEALAEFTSGAPLAPEQVLVVGDSLSKDILPAESIGCRTAWIKGRGWPAAEDAAEHPSRISSLESLLIDLHSVNPNTSR